MSFVPHTSVGDSFPMESAFPFPPSPSLNVPELPSEAALPLEDTPLSEAPAEHPHPATLLPAAFPFPGGRSVFAGMKPFTQEDWDALMEEASAPQQGGKESAQRAQSTAFLHFERALGVLGLSLPPVQLQAGARVLNVHLKGWTDLALLRARQRYSSFRDTYVPNLFRALEARGVLVEDDAKSFVSLHLKKLLAEGKLEVKQYAESDGANPLLYADIHQALQAAPVSWSLLPSTSLYAVLGVASGHRFVTLSALESSDIKVLHDSSRTIHGVELFFRKTKGKLETNWPHWLSFLGTVEIDADALPATNVPFWLHAQIRALGYPDGLHTDLSKEKVFAIFPRLTADGIADHFDRFFGSAGYPEHFFSAHSTRSGFVTESIVGLMQQKRDGPLALTALMLKRWAPDSRHFFRYIKVQAFDFFFSHEFTQSFQRALLLALPPQSMQSISSLFGLTNGRDDAQEGAHDLIDPAASISVTAPFAPVPPNWDNCEKFHHITLGDVKVNERLQLSSYLTIQDNFMQCFFAKNEVPNTWRTHFKIAVIIALGKYNEVPPHPEWQQKFSQGFHLIVTKHETTVPLHDRVAALWFEHFCEVHCQSIKAKISSATAAALGSSDEGDEVHLYGEEDLEETPKESSKRHRGAWSQADMDLLVTAFDSLLQELPKDSQGRFQQKFWTRLQSCYRDASGSARDRQKIRDKLRTMKKL